MGERNSSYFFISSLLEIAKLPSEVPRDWHLQEACLADFLHLRKILCWHATQFMSSTGIFWGAPQSQKAIRDTHILNLTGSWPSPQRPITSQSQTALSLACAPKSTCSSRNKHVCRGAQRGKGEGICQVGWFTFLSACRIVLQTLSEPCEAFFYLLLFLGDVQVEQACKTEVRLWKPHAPGIPVKARVLDNSQAPAVGHGRCSSQCPQAI